MSDPYIKRLEAEKEALEQRIKEFQGEIRTINNLIYRRKSEIFADSTNQETNLKNADRLFFETIIIDALNASKRGLRTKDIYTSIKKSGFGINYNTLRTYVMRMRDKKLIKKNKADLYYWIAVEDESEKDTQNTINPR